MRSKAKTVAAYLAELSPERRAVVSAVRRLVKRHVPAGYREAMGWGAITWSVPMRVSGPTHNGLPLYYVALVSQKQWITLHLMGPYGDRRLRKRLEDGFRRAGKRLDMGGSCVHFKTFADLPADVVGEVIAAVPMRAYPEFFRRAREGPRHARSR